MRTSSLFNAVCNLPLNEEFENCNVNKSNDSKHSSFKTTNICKSLTKTVVVNSCVNFFIKVKSEDKILERIELTEKSSGLLDDWVPNPNSFVSHSCSPWWRTFSWIVMMPHQVYIIWHPKFTSNCLYIIIVLLVITVLISETRWQASNFKT